MNIETLEGITLQPSSRHCLTSLVARSTLLCLPTTLLSVTTGQDQQSKELCSTQVCISATVFSKDPKNIEFSLYSKVPVGWLGIGIGGSPNSMPGNDIALCWPNATGNGALISHRSATVNGAPTPLAAGVSFKVQQAKSGLTSSNKDFACTFKRPLNLTTAPIPATATSLNVIFAVGLQAVRPATNGDPQQAAIQRHTYTGHGALTIQRKDGLSSDPNNTVTPPPQTNPGTNPGSEQDEILAAERLYQQLVKAHGILMTIAFLLIFPSGAIIVRFFGHLQHVFRWHRPIQVTGFLTVIAAFCCILVAVYKTPEGPPPLNESTHSILGVALLCALILQITFGIYIFHTFNPSVDLQKAFHRVTTMIHRLWGYSILIGGVIQVKLGLDRYGMWPTGKETIWYVFYVWIAAFAAIFVLGSLVKFVRRPKGETNKGDYNHEDSKHQNNNRQRGIEEDQYELQQHRQH
ncbi:hypothetical protein BGX27_003477 [Mortierella sp. AM989]|nr:hypothetical protein BGX27_003477 [Mortierella sp. AM989]